MRILYVINNLNKGGAERLIVDSLPLFKKRGIDVTVLQLESKSSEHAYIDELRSNNIEVFSFNPHSLYNPILALRLRKFFKHGQYNLIQVNLFPAMYWAAIAKAIGGTSKLIFIEHSSGNKRLTKCFYRPFDRLVYSAYHKVIAVSPVIYEKLKKWIGTDKSLELIRNGVNIAKFQDAESYNRGQLTRNYELPNDCRILMMTARFADPKDQITVVNSLKCLPQNYHIFFTGDGQRMEEVRQHCIKNGVQERVHFLGFRTDVSNLMRSVDFNILSSRYEGMSGVTLEALAVKRPFLGTDVNGINDLVPDGRFLFPYGNYSHLAKQILKIDNDNSYAQKMVTDGSDFVKQFDIGIMIDKYIDLYKRVLEE